MRRVISWHLDFWIDQLHTKVHLAKQVLYSQSALYNRIICECQVSSTNVSICNCNGGAKIFEIILKHGFVKRENKKVLVFGCGKMHCKKWFEFWTMLQLQKCSFTEEYQITHSKGVGKFIYFFYIFYSWLGSTCETIWCNSVDKSSVQVIFPLNFSKFWLERERERMEREKGRGSHCVLVLHLSIR